MSVLTAAFTRKDESGIINNRSMCTISFVFVASPFKLRFRTTALEWTLLLFRILRLCLELGEEEEEDDGLVDVGRYCPCVSCGGIFDSAGAGGDENLPSFCGVLFSPDGRMITNSPFRLAPLPGNIFPSRFTHWWHSNGIWVECEESVGVVVMSELSASLFKFKSSALWTPGMERCTKGDDSCCCWVRKEVGRLFQRFIIHMPRDLLPSP